MLSSSASGSVLPGGKISLRQAFYYSYATSFWIPTLVEYEGKATVAGAKTTASFGLRYGLQVDVGLTLTNARLLSGSAPVVNRLPGESETGIAEVAFQVTKRLYPATLKDFGRYELLTYLGVRAPGNPAQSPFDFLALNDGSLKVDLGFVNTFYLGELISATLDLKYIARSRPAVTNQLAANLTVPFVLSPMVQVGILGAYFHTFGGYDIEDAAFAQRALELGNNRIPTVFLHETSMGAGAFLNFVLSEFWNVDLYGFTKLAGTNTDKGTSLGLGFTYTF